MKISDTVYTKVNLSHYNNGKGSWWWKLSRNHLNGKVRGKLQTKAFSSRLMHRIRIPIIHAVRIQIAPEMQGLPSEIVASESI